MFKTNRGEGMLILILGARNLLQNIFSAMPIAIAIEQNTFVGVPESGLEKVTAPVAIIAQGRQHTEKAGG